MKKILGTMFLGLSVLLTPLMFALPAQAVTSWDTTGSYTVNFGGFVFDMNLVQDGLGNLTGGGGYPAGGTYAFALTITSGTVEGNIINITADYTLGAVGTTVQLTGTIAPDGSMSGTWSDNYGGGTRTGTWATVTGTALNNDPTNVAPVLANIPVSPVSIPELSPYSFDANATDADGDTLTFSLSGAPAGATINGASGVFNWTPSELQGPGDYTFNVMVSDGLLSDSQSVTIHVTEVDGETAPTSPQTMDDCKNGGWMTFTNPPFRNQGLCVSWTNHQWTWTPGGASGIRGYAPEPVTVSSGSSDRGQSGRRMFVTEVNSEPVPTAPGNSGNGNGRSLRMFGVGTSGEFTPTSPDSENECRDGGWMTFNSPAFRSQGQCISWMLNHQ